MRRGQPYTAQFYEERNLGSLRSAEAIIGHLLRLMSFRSVVDVGCGAGTWLRALGMHGVSDVLGIDGDYIDRAALGVPDDRFLPRDLTMPVKLDRTFDLAMSLEVAEHLPRMCIRFRTLTGWLGADRPVLGSHTISRREPPCQRTVARLLGQPL